MLHKEELRKRKREQDVDYARRKRDSSRLEIQDLQQQESLLRQQAINLRREFHRLQHLVVQAESILQAIDNHTLQAWARRHGYVAQSHAVDSISSGIMPGHLYTIQEAITQTLRLGTHSTTSGMPLETHAALNALQRHPFAGAVQVERIHEEALIAQAVARRLQVIELQANQALLQRIHWPSLDRHSSPFQATRGAVDRFLVESRNEITAETGSAKQNQTAYEQVPDQE